MRRAIRFLTTGVLGSASLLTEAGLGPAGPRAQGAEPDRTNSQRP